MQRRGLRRRPVAGAKGTDTAVKEGSRVQGFKTALPDDED